MDLLAKTCPPFASFNAPRCSAIDDEGNHGSRERCTVNTITGEDGEEVQGQSSARVTRLKI